MSVALCDEAGAPRVVQMQVGPIPAREPLRAASAREDVVTLVLSTINEDDSPPGTGTLTFVGQAIGGRAL